MWYIIKIQDGMMPRPVYYSSREGVVDEPSRASMYMKKPKDPVKRLLKTSQFRGWDKHITIMEYDRNEQS